VLTTVVTARTRTASFRRSVKTVSGEPHNLAKTAVFVAEQGGLVLKIKNEKKSFIVYFNVIRVLFYRNIRLALLHVFV